jgi:hypothetical protein
LEPAPARDSHRTAGTGLVLLIALLSLLAAGKAIFYDTLDPDCFWHLRVAEQLQQDGIGPLVDRISFASIKTPWTPYSWLAELGMKAIWDIGGFRAAILAQALMMAGFVALVAMSAHELSNRANPFGVVLATVFAMYFSLPYLSFRPVTFAIVMLALCTWLLLRDRRLGETSRAVWWIVPITVLITNCHFFSVLVPMCVAALLGGAMWEHRNIRRYALMLGLTTGGCAATPMLPGMLRTMWDYQFSDPVLDAGFVSEFQSVWAGPLGWASAMLLLFWIVCLIRHRTLRVGEILWGIGALLLVLRLGRFAPVFAPIGAALLCATLPRPRATVLHRLPIRIAAACVLILGVVRLVSAFPASDSSMSDWLNRHGPDTPGYPCAAADYVAENLPPGRIINEFSWGGYLCWRLGPDYPILLDGRTQLYTPDFWRAMYVSDLSRAGEIFATCRATAAVIPITRSRFRNTLVDLGWRSAYRDDRAEVLVSSQVESPYSVGYTGSD